jgi:membrane dipeptidase
MLVDLSHVGPRTTQEAIATSKAPVAFTHVAPLSLKQHPRNKTDEEMRLVAEHGGIVGVTFLTWFLKAGPDATLEHCVRAIEQVINVAGEEHVAIGTDFTEGYGRDFLEWILRDQGYGRLLSSMPLESTGLDMPRGLTRIADLPNLVQAMRDAGWSEERIHRVAAGNWKRLLGEVWPGTFASDSLVTAGAGGSR